MNMVLNNMSACSSNLIEFFLRSEITLSMSSSGASNVQERRGGKDPAWDWGKKVPNKANKVECNFCKNEYGGGITRLKEHLGHVSGNVRGCPMVPDDVKQKALALLNKTKEVKEGKTTELQNLLKEVRVGEEEEEETVREESSSRKTTGQSSRRTTGPMDQFAIRSVEEAVEAAQRQPIAQSERRKKGRDDAVRYIARFFYEGGLAFNLATLPSFVQMVQAIGMYGPNLQTPSPYELSESFLQREVEETNATLETFKRSCKTNGCTLMTDAWSDRKGRSLMNIVVHCPAGTAFLLSQDASSERHDGSYIHKFVTRGMNEVGAENVVQIVTDNASNNMAAANTLALTHPSIFWTSCAAHTINLMLADIGKIKHIRSAILMGRSVSVYIYSHTKSLDIMRKAIGGELIRPGTTRFATAYLSLASIRENKKELQHMFISDDWLDCTLSRTDAGKKVAEIIASNKFWDNTSIALKIFTPLVKVLRRVDGDKVPSMGFLYGDLEHAKEEIRDALGGEEKKYLPIWKIIDRRWDDKLKGPLHRAGYFLNPLYYYAKQPEIDIDGSFMAGFVDVMHRFYPDDHERVDKIAQQLPMYQNQNGSFGLSFARAAVKRIINPAQWWQFYGTDAPELRIMAMRILSLTTSSSGCERNWSTFEMVHTKKRNRLSSKKLHDLVFVKFNARLKSKLSIPNRDPLVAYNEEEKVTEWLMPEKRNGDPYETSDDEVFPGEQLTFRQVSIAMGADPRKRKSERVRASKSKISRTAKGKASSSSKSKQRLASDEEDEEEADTSSSDSSSDDEHGVPPNAPVESESS